MSVELVERFFTTRFMGMEELTAREADAFTILEQEWRAEAHG
jgi:hypothetical protein